MQTRARNPTVPSSADFAGSPRGTSGVVYVEFLIAFTPVFLMILGMAQIALLYIAHMVVQHSATTAVRAAIVVLPDDPARYGGAAVNNVADGRRLMDMSAVEGVVYVLRGAVSGHLPAIPGFSGGADGRGRGVDPGDAVSVYADANARLVAVHDAASIPLLAISPSMQQLAPDLFGRRQSLMEAIGSDNPAVRAATGALLYNRAGLSVTFPRAGSGRAEYVNRWSSRDEPVTVRVTYLFHCAVPIARRLMCEEPLEMLYGSFDELRRVVGDVLGAPPSGAEVASILRHVPEIVRGEGVSGVSTATADAIRARLREVENRRSRLQAGIGELAAAPWGGGALAASFTGQRFRILRGQATMPLQGANYTYRSSRSAVP